MAGLIAVSLFMLGGWTVVEAMHYRHQDTSSHTNNQIDDWTVKDSVPHDIESWPSMEALKDKAEDAPYLWLDDDLVQKDRRPDGLMRLPGGCEMTLAQYQKLQQFRKDVDYVQNCYCQDGSVYCKLKQGGDHVHIT